ncbi:MAG TPA: sensor histidine kinase KdpD [Bacteroidales bacterium]|nr:sensor histidine kinase KdpD [Bacteroidales bacterium]
MTDFEGNRPDPDELLSSLHSEEEKSRKGKLKIFFGMCAGVGKTYSMLQDAILIKSKGTDVVIGYVETHNRAETAALADALEMVPRKQCEYKTASLQEMDIDAILARKPQVVLVDELAHTNAPGNRHTKRYQDVLELLDNGIHVYTTLNVQHLESRSEIVAQITGIIVRETVPDEIFENANEIEIVDITPEELLQRLDEGKIYTPDRSREAVLNFFRKGNITALREMALRIVADRVDKQLLDYMQNKQIRGPWKSGLHLLVAIDYQAQSSRLLRWAKNLAYSMGANIQAVYVETLHKLTPKEEEQLNKNINLAKQLKIKFRIITNTNVVKAIAAFAQKENITQIIVGKPRTRNLISMLQLGNFINKLIRYSGNIDVYILGSDNKAKDKFVFKASVPSFTSNVSQYVLVFSLVVLMSFFSYLLEDYVGYQVVSFCLLFLVSILAIFFGTGPILLAAISSALIWDFFFIPPRGTLHIKKPEDVLMFLMFFIIALLNGILTSRVRRQQVKIRIREERTHALYQITRDLSMATGIKEVNTIVSKYIHKYFRLEFVLLLKTEQEQLSQEIKNETTLRLNENDISITQWVFKHSLKAGKYTDTLPSSAFTFYPLIGNNSNVGVIAVAHPKVFTQGEEQFWEACISQIASKYEREFLRIAARKAYVLGESDKLYKTLFNSISHELRIPVATILGATDTLQSQTYPEDIKQKLYHEISVASLRLNRLIENLLNMSRLESGHISLRPDWCDVHDLANNLQESLRQELTNHKLTTIIPVDMPLVKIDFGILEHILYNLVLNAIQYTPANTRIRLKFYYDNGNLMIQVMDRGRGFEDSEIPRIFEKFYRGKDVKTGGTGLGLSIVKGFVEAHRGNIAVVNRENGGAKFTIRIPCESSNDLVIQQSLKRNENNL